MTETLQHELDSYRYVVLAEGHDEDSRGSVLAQLQIDLHRRFGLHHLTIQIEPPDFASADCAKQHCH